jgi:hypothetical protein
MEGVRRSVLGVSWPDLRVVGRLGLLFSDTAGRLVILSFSHNIMLQAAHVTGSGGLPGRMVQWVGVNLKSSMLRWSYSVLA